MQTLEEAILEAFEYLEATYQPKWTTGKGAKDNLIKAFSQNLIPKHIALGFLGSDGLRHSFGRAIPNHNKPKSVRWETWLLNNIHKFQCIKCDVVYDNSFKYDLHKNICKSCEKIKSVSNRQSNQEYVYKVLSESSGCVDCGEKDPIVLEFDHRDPATKVFNIGDSYSKPLEKLKLEINKCDIVCANCHRKRTAKVFNYYKYTRNT